MSNDNRKPMSPLGSALFDMLRDMGQAQARIYSKGGAPDEAQREVERLAALHQPIITEKIVRPSQK